MNRQQPKSKYFLLPKTGVALDPVAHCAVNGSEAMLSQYRAQVRARLSLPPQCHAPGMYVP